jgi:UPF0755 protein
VSPRGKRGGGARSEDDRQRARLEREQRRAEREGRPVPRSIADLPVAEPSLDLGGAGGGARPGAPGRSTTESDGPAADGGEGPAGRRERLAALRAGTEPGAPRPTDPRPAAAPRPSAAATPDREPSVRPSPTEEPQHDAVSRGPWWSRGAAGPPPPPQQTPPAAPSTSTGTVPSRAPAPSHEPGGAPSDRPGEASGPSSAPGPPSREQAPRPRIGPPGSGPVPARPEPDDWFDGDGDAPDHDPRARRDARPRATTGGPESHATRRVDDHALLRGRDEDDDHDDQRPIGTIDAATRNALPEPPTKGRRFRRKRDQSPAAVHVRKAPARRGVSRIAAVVVLVPLVLLVAGFVFLFQPFHGDGEGEIRVRIKPGSSVDDIGKLLKEKGVVSNSLAFAIRARISGEGSNLKAGVLRLKRDMSYGAALKALQQDPLPPSVVRVSIPEGLSRAEIAASIKKAGVTGSYLTASARSKGFNPRTYGQPRGRKGLEGFLFPATYELQRGGATSSALVTEQLKAFKENFSQVSMRRAKRANLSDYDVLIIASMIEREVRIPSERKLVSSVIYNRLKAGMPLGIDATTRYALKNWSTPLKDSDFDEKDPYDTRRRKGLPPTPIGSPGLASMKAAANPASTKDIYYVVKPCGGGKHAFSTNNAEFQKDSAAYKAAQQRAGGDPSPKNAKGCRS